MPLPEDLTQHPTPAQVYELAVDYAALLRALFYHPEFKFLEPPTAQISKIDPDKTNPALFWVTDFVQNTYVNNVIPFLPQGSTRKCREISNPWAYADPTYNWELTWDSEAGALKDASGSSVSFPKLSQASVREKMEDLVGRGFMTRKLILDNQTDVKAQLLMGGQSFEFGDEVKAAARKIAG